MTPRYDVFFSHAHADNSKCRVLREALEAAGLSVWYDEDVIETFDGITQAVITGLNNAKALLAYYSEGYPTRRACQ